jgi:hypothetical protein
MVQPVPSFSRTIHLCAVPLIATLTLGQCRASAKNLAQDINQQQRPATPHNKIRIEADRAESESESGMLIENLRPAAALRSA